MNRFLVWLAGIGYSSIFGLSFLMTKNALDLLSPPELMFLRFSIAALTMSLLRLLGILKLDYRRANWKHLAATCLFQPVLYFLFETYGVRESTSSLAGIVIGAIPASVAVTGAIMLGEKLNARQVLYLSLSVVGVALSVVFSPGGGGIAASPAGVLLLVGAVAAAALYNIYSRKTSRGLAPMETTFAMMWTGALFFGLMTLVLSLAGSGGSGNAVGAETAAGAALAMSGTGTGLAVDQSLLARAAGALPALAYLGLASSVGAFFLINYTLSKLRASQSAIFSSLTTLVSVAAGVLFRNEAFGLAQALGAVMIIAGVWGTNAGPAARAGTGSRKTGA